MRKICRRTSLEKQKGHSIAGGDDAIGVSPFTLCLPLSLFSLFRNSQGMGNHLHRVLERKQVHFLIQRVLGGLGTGGLVPKRNYSRCKEIIQGAIVSGPGQDFSEPLEVILNQ